MTYGGKKRDFDTYVMLYRSPRKKVQMQKKIEEQKLNSICKEVRGLTRSKAMNKMVVFCFFFLFGGYVL